MQIGRSPTPKALAILLSTACLLALPLAASAAERGFDQFQGAHTIVVQYPYPYGWGWGWGYYPYYYYDTRGKIKIRDYFEYDQVYINGAYAGTAKKRHEIKLEPGRYRIEVRRRGKELVNREVYVLTQKTVEINVP
jgi:hypothetical protein